MRWYWCVHFAGYGAGDSNSQAIITPVLAIGTGAGAIYLVSVSTFQVTFLHTQR